MLCPTLAHVSVKFFWLPRSSQSPSATEAAQAELNVSSVELPNWELHPTLRIRVSCTCAQSGPILYGTIIVECIVMCMLTATRLGADLICQNNEIVREFSDNFCFSSTPALISLWIYLEQESSHRSKLASVDLLSGYRGKNHRVSSHSR